jgi:hypothetical protein
MIPKFTPPPKKKNLGGGGDDDQLLEYVTAWNVYVKAVTGDIILGENYTLYVLFGFLLPH